MELKKLLRGLDPEDGTFVRSFQCTRLGRAKVLVGLEFVRSLFLRTTQLR